MNTIITGLVMLVIGFCCGGLIAKNRLNKWYTQNLSDIVKKSMFMLEQAGMIAFTDKAFKEGLVTRNDE